MFKEGHGDWTNFRNPEKNIEIDFHHKELEYNGGYEEKMAEVWSKALAAIIHAQEKGMEHVIFTHGHSTSRIGKTTSRSQVRKLMRSKEATPYIIRSKCIQHSSVFVAAIKPSPKNSEK